MLKVVVQDESNHSPALYSQGAEALKNALYRYIVRLHISTVHIQAINFVLIQQLSTQTHYPHTTPMFQDYSTCTFVFLVHVFASCYTQLQHLHKLEGVPPLQKIVGEQIHYTSQARQTHNFYGGHENKFQGVGGRLLLKNFYGTIKFSILFIQKNFKRNKNYGRKKRNIRNRTNAIRRNTS